MRLCHQPKKFKQLRLQALTVAPTSFSSTYETESARANAEWVSRLAMDGKETFACAAIPIKSSPSNPDTTEQSTWVGQLTLLGPQSRESFILPEESGQKDPPKEGDRELWQMLSYFTLPEHHGQGLSKRLCQEALDYLTLYKQSPPEVRMRLMVGPNNPVAFGLYRGLGFAEAGFCTLAEALIANGDKHMLPEDISEEKYNSRIGTIMTLEIYCS